MLGHSPIDHIKKNPDISFMRLDDEIAENGPLLSPLFFTGKAWTDRVQTEVPVTVAVIERRGDPDTVDSHFRHVIEGALHSF